MKKAIILITFAAFAFACGSETSDNSNGNGNGPVTKEFNSQPMDNSGKPIPGIPDPANANITDRAPGGTPTPGIPEPGKADITNQKGGTPTPGIPDAATRERMIKEMNKNPNAVNTAPKEPPASKDGPLNRPRKSQP